MKTLLALLGLAALALAGTRMGRQVARERSSTGFFVLSGGVYLVVGMLLGSSGAAWVGPGVLEHLVPLIGFALGWVGALLGSQIRRPLLARMPGRLYGVSALLATLPAVAVVVCFRWLGSSGSPIEVPGWPASGMELAVLAAGAAAFSPLTLGFAQRLVASPERLAPLLSAAGLVNLLPLATALVLPVVGLGDAEGGGELLALGLVGALGVGSGFLLSWLLGQTAPRRDQFLLLLGAVTLVAGLSIYFRLSPLGVTFVAMVVFVNSGQRSRSWSIEVLTTFERPIYMGLLLLAGALLPPTPLGPMLLTLGIFLLLRVGAASLTGWVAERAAGGVLLPRGAVSWVLLPQGGLGLALLVEAQLLYPDLLSPLVRTTLTLGFLLFELAGPAAVRRLAAADLRAREEARPSSEGTVP